MPWMASNSAVATVLYSPSNTPSQKKITLRGRIFRNSINRPSARSIILRNDSITISTQGCWISAKATYILWLLHRKKKLAQLLTVLRLPDPDDRHQPLETY